MIYEKEPDTFSLGKSNSKVTVQEFIDGENASLDVGGSFVGTTANGIGLGEEGSFNATEPQTSNLLSVNPSALFFNAVAAQPIVNRSQATGINGETNSLGYPVGLKVPENKTLALVGGNVFLDGGNLTATRGRLELGSVTGVGQISFNQSGDNFLDGAQISTQTLSEGNGGSLNVNVAKSIKLIGTSTDGQFGSGLFASTEGNGDAGSLSLSTEQLTILDGAAISNESIGTGNAGNLNLDVSDTLLADDSDISTNANKSSGNAINITAGDIRLRGDSDIRTNVSTGTGNGGNINLIADSIVAFDDSDIIASASDGSGGDIKLDTPAFFGDGYQDSDSNTDQNSLDGNNRADINATGAFNGIITIPDVSFIQNNLATLPQVFIDTDSLIASSCIARREQQTGSFTITGNDSLPTPSQSNNSAYPTGTVQTFPSRSFDDNRPWKKGDPIIEPTGVYRLPNGELVMSRECSQ
jgi:large exoprotein involved in heme utilization and adhesion